MKRELDFVVRVTVETNTDDVVSRHIESAMAEMSLGEQYVGKKVAVMAPLALPQYLHVNAEMLQYRQEWD